MKVRVSEQGVIVPRELLEGAEEVEIHKEDHRVVITPIVGSDPIWGLGEQPVVCGIDDGSINHDTYLYGFNS